MKTLHFSIEIKAPREKVWKTLWEDATYRQWTAVFYESSHAVSDWEEGSKILFLSADGNGMHSMIDKKIPNKQMTFRHLGIVKDGVEQPDDEKTGEWKDALESYFLTENNGVTELKAELNTVEAYEQYFKDTFPKALEKVKHLAEHS